MATLAHITDPNVKRQVARNLQVQAWYLKTVNETTAFDLRDFEFKVFHGLYRHEGSAETLSPGSINDLARTGRAISYQVVNRISNEVSNEKTFDTAVFLKNFMPFDKLILEYDSYNPDGSLTSYITLVIPNIPQNFNGVRFQNKILTKYNGTVHSDGELVEITAVPQAQPTPADVAEARGLVGPPEQRDFGDTPESEVMAFLRDNISGPENNGYSFIASGTQWYVTTNSSGGRFLTDNLEDFYNQQNTFSAEPPLTPADFQ